MKRDEIRMKLWCDAYVANMAGTGTAHPGECADGAVAMFDLRFPEHEPHWHHPPPPSSSMVIGG